MKSKLPTERKVFQFDQASVVYTAEHSRATDLVMPKLYVQVIDQYGYQRELIVEFKHRAGDSKAHYWEMHAYRHVGRREIQELSKEVAERFILRFLDICEKHPIFLFNHADASGSPRSGGFVHLSELLLDGEPCSVKLLD